jgi:hypothetical protein
MKYQLKFPNLKIKKKKKKKITRKQNFCDLIQTTIVEQNTLQIRNYNNIKCKPYNSFNLASIWNKIYTGSLYFLENFFSTRYHCFPCNRRHQKTLRNMVSRGDLFNGAVIAGPKLKFC